MRGRVPRSRVTHDRWLVSYADFITLLFAFFVVLYAFATADHKKQRQVSEAINSGLNSLGAFSSSSSDAASAGEKSRSAAVQPLMLSPDRVKSDLDQIRRKLSRDLAAEIQARAVAIEINREGLVISLREAGFFASGSAVPRPEAMETLRKIATALTGAPYDLRIEGHTDNVPVHTAEFDSNWELSASRATHIARLVLELDAVPPDRLSVAGYGEFHPVADNATPDGRAQNRRVDLVVLPRTTLDFSASEPSHPTTEWRKITDEDTN